MAPSVETLVELVRACGFDLPLELVVYYRSADVRLEKNVLLSPERRERGCSGSGGSWVAETLPPFDPRALPAALERRRVSYVVIGAFARVIQGAEETTDGIDIVVSLREENLRRLAEALEELGGRHTDVKKLSLSPEVLAGERVLAFGDRSGRVEARAPSGGDARWLQRSAAGGNTRAAAGHLRHSYALTGHASQGLTAQRAFVLGTGGGELKEWGYVDQHRVRWQAFASLRLEEQAVKGRARDSHLVLQFLSRRPGRRSAEDRDTVGAERLGDGAGRPGLAGSCAADDADDSISARTDRSQNCLLVVAETYVALKPRGYPVDRPLTHNRCADVVAPFDQSERSPLDPYQLARRVAGRPAGPSLLFDALDTVELEEALAE